MAAAFGSGKGKKRGAFRHDGVVTALAFDTSVGEKLLGTMPIRLLSPLMQSYRAMVAQVTKEHGGTILEDLSFGSRHVALFTRPSQAVRCALQLHVQAEELDPDRPVLQLRMGIASGECDLDTIWEYSAVVQRAEGIRSLFSGPHIGLDLSTQELARMSISDEIAYVDLGAKRLRTTETIERLFVLAHDRLPSFDEKGWTGENHNLPARTTLFIGREAEIASAKRSLDLSRLVTLGGVTGIGKSSLAVRVAMELLDAYPDGVWYLDLMHRGGSREIIDGLAHIFKLGAQRNRSLRAVLLDHLASKECLLVLDNLDPEKEQEVGFIQELLSRASSCSVLATSRVKLGIKEETALTVPPMSIVTSPAEEERPDMPEALSLFLDRLWAVGAPGDIQDSRIPLIVSICRKLDGIPLAIELAAAQAAASSIEEVERRLQERGNLDTETSSHLEPMHASIEASYSRLSERDQAAFRALSVFSGGWTLGAARHVLAGFGIEGAAFDETHRNLVEMSLVVRRSPVGYEGKYALLGPVREFALAKLHRDGKYAAARELHCTWCLDMVEQKSAEVLRSDQKVWLRYLDSMSENIDAALWWSLQPMCPSDRRHRFVQACYPYWLRRNRVLQGINYCQSVLAFPEADQTIEKARAHTIVAVLLQLQESIVEARQHLHRALAIYEALDHRIGQAATYSNLAICDQRDGRHDQAAESLYSALRLLEDQEDDVRKGAVHANLATVLPRLNRIDEAREALESAYELLAGLQDRYYRAVLAAAEGYIWFFQNDYRRAEIPFQESFTYASDIDDHFYMAQSLLFLSLCSWELGEPETAARRLGAMYGSYELDSVAVPSSDRYLVASLESNLRRVLGTERYEELREANQADPRAWP